MLNGKRIIIVLYSLELGGAERQALLLGRYLAQVEGAHVQVWAFCNPGRAAKLCEGYGIPWRIVPLRSPRRNIELFKASVKLGWLLRRAQPDIILPYLTYPNVLCGLIWRWTGARLCIWNQRSGGNDRLRLRRPEHWAIRMTPYFISNSQHGADFLVQTFNVQPDKIRVIYNGIELPRPESDRATWRKRLEVSEDCFLACMVANLCTVKDHATLLRAWRIVLDRSAVTSRSTILLLAGRFDNTSEALKALAYDLELGRSVRFLGQIDDISGLLSAVDLGVFSSRSEGCPNGILECMASGLAMVGTDVPGIREAVGVDGYPFLVPPGDAEALADRILKLVVNSELRTKLGRVNCHRVKTEFNLQRMGLQTVTFIAHGLRVVEQDSC